VRYTLFHVYFRFQVAIFNCSLTLTPSFTNVRPNMLFDAKDMRIPLKFHTYSICNVRFNLIIVFQVSRPPFWFPVELALNCVQGDIAIGSGDFGILKNIRSNVEFASKVDLRPLIQWSPSLSHFHQINHPHHLYFRWRNSTSGWTISKISTSFHHALMVLGIRRSAIENSDGQLRYSRKTRVDSFVVRCSRVKHLINLIIWNVADAAARRTGGL